MRPWKRYAGWPARDGSKFNTLGQVSSPPAASAPRKLAGPITGDAAKGAELVADRNRGGSCLACHVMGPAAAPTCRVMSARSFGNWQFGREDEYLFNYIYDPRVYNPETVMPPWGGHGLFNDQEINDMVAFLKTLKCRPLSRPRSTTPKASGRRSRNAKISTRSKIPACGRSTGRRSFGSRRARPASRARAVTPTPPNSKRGRLDAKVGAAARQGAGCGGVCHPPRQGRPRAPTG